MRSAVSQADLQKLVFSQIGSYNKHNKQHVYVFSPYKLLRIINQSDQSKIVLNYNYDLIGYPFFRSIRSYLEMNRASYAVGLMIGWSKVPNWFIPYNIRPLQNWLIGNFDLVSVIRSDVSGGFFGQFLFVLIGLIFLCDATEIRTNSSKKLWCQKFRIKI